MNCTVCKKSIDEDDSVEALFVDHTGPVTESDSEFRDVCVDCANSSQDDLANGTPIFRYRRVIVG